jgi:SPP1 gp7 family putative phage head morphogenesis protein
MAEALKTGVARQEVGQVAFALLNEQVDLIKSLPIEAGLRAQDIAAENFLAGRRAAVDPETVARLKEEMGMSTEVAVNRARLIARTETARANASFVQARAQSVGVLGYIWRTTMDGAERHSHAEMNGVFVPYNKVPHLSDGTKGHAGTFPNCRCWQDPVLPE